MRRAFAATVAALLILSGAVNICASDADNLSDNEKTDIVIDFTGSKKVVSDENFTYSNGINVTIGNVDREHGKSLIMSPLVDRASEVGKKPDSAISEGKYYISFEYRTIGDVNAVFNLVDKDGYEFDMFALTENGTKYGVPPHETTDWTKPGVYADSLSDRWYKADIWLDMDTYEAQYYVDGEHFTDFRIHSWLKDISTFNIRAEQGGKLFVDNIRLSYVDQSLTDELLSEGVTVPDNWKTPYDIVIETGQIGNIYFSNSEFKFNVTIRNKKECSSRLMITSAVLQRENGYELCSSKKELSIAPNAVETVEIKLKPKKYELLNIRVTAEDLESGETFSEETEASTVHNIESGKKLSRLGTQTHFTPGYVREGYGKNSDVKFRQGEIDKLMPLIDAAGFGTVRDELSWSDYDLGEGVYEMPQRNIDILDSVKSYGIDYITGVGGANWIYSREHPPRSPEVLEPFAEYARRTVLEYMKWGFGKYMEVWNEYSLGTFNRDGATPADYVKMLEAVYPAYHAANPDVKVLGLVSPENSQAWVREVLEAGGAPYMDAASTHPYQDYRMIAPEQNDEFVNYAKSFRELLAEYGRDDIELWATEFGYSRKKWGNERAMDYTLQSLILSDAHGLYDFLSYYLMQDRTSEDGLGLIETYQNIPVPYGAHEAFLGICNYIATVYDTTFKEIINIDDKVNAYKYVRADGEEIIAMWSSSRDYNFSVDLGCDRIIKSDAYGNETAVNAVDGKYAFNLTNTPVYIKGFFPKFEIYKEMFTVDSNEVSIYDGGEFDINITKNIPNECTVKLYLPNNVTLVHNSGFVGNSANIRLKANKTGADSTTVYGCVCSGGTECYDFSFKINYEDNISVGFTVRPASYVYRDRWQAVITVDNKSDEAVGGTAVIEAPENVGSANSEFGLTPAEPGETADTIVNLPGSFAARFLNFKGKVKLDNGETVGFDKTFELLLSPRAKKPPEIDGVLSEDEYDYKNCITVSDKAHVVGRNYIPTWKGPQDLSAEVYTAWDDDYYYFAAKVRDDIHNLSPDTPDNSLWMGDSIQMAFAKEKGASRLISMVLGLRSGESLIYANGEIINGQNGTDCKIVRSGEYTIYEMKLSWKTILGEENEQAPKDKIATSMLFNDDDGDGRRGWMEFGSGIGSGINTNLYFNMLLLDDK